MGEAEDVKTDIEATRASLNQKLEALETGVRDTVDNVKTTAEERIVEVQQKVHRTFSLKHHIRRRPWAFFGAAVGAGMALGILARRAHLEEDPSYNALGGAGQPAPRAPHPLLTTFHDEIQLVKGTAIGMLMGVLRDLARDLLPDTVSEKVDQVADGMTTKLGGEPISGRVVSP